MASALLHLPPLAVPGHDRLRVALVAADAEGGWSDRYLTSFHQRYAAPHVLPGWCAVLLWSGDTHTPSSVVCEALAEVVRTAYRVRHPGRPTLGQFLLQEAGAALLARAPGPALPGADCTAILDLLTPDLRSTHFATIYRLAWGDGPSRAAGFDAPGLPAFAGVDTTRSLIARSRHDTAVLLAPQLAKAWRSRITAA